MLYMLIFFKDNFYLNGPHQPIRIIGWVIPKRFKSHFANVKCNQSIQCDYFRSKNVFLVTDNNEIDIL